MTTTTANKPVRRKVRLGTIHVDDLSFNGAIDAIAAAVKAGEGGFVVTPNVDHVCMAETDLRLREAYKHATLSLIDGMPLLWLAKALGNPLPEKISGSDLLRPLMQRAAKEGWKVYFLGGRPGVAEQAANILLQDYPGFTVAGVDAPPMGFENDRTQANDVLVKIRLAKPHLLLVALGCPKQELWMHQNVKAFGPAVALGIGATLDFVAGVVKRAPAWMSKVGLEWLYRLLQEPRRMAGRYLVRDRAILWIAIRSFLSPKQNRVFFS